jgi:hypothetical protein
MGVGWDMARSWKKLGPGKTSDNIKRVPVDMDAVVATDVDLDSTGASMFVGLKILGSRLRPVMTCPYLGVVG